MSIADDLCNGVRSQAALAEHFKNLWMQANIELESEKARTAELLKLVPKEKLGQLKQLIYSSLHITVIMTVIQLKTFVQCQTNNCGYIVCAHSCRSTRQHPKDFRH